jgi:hypothetical protein
VNFTTITAPAEADGLSEPAAMMAIMGEMPSCVPAEEIRRTALMQAVYLRQMALPAAWPGRDPEQCEHGDGRWRSEECRCPPPPAEEVAAYTAACESAEVDRTLRIARVFAAYIAGESADDADAALRQWRG